MFEDKEKVIKVLVITLSSVFAISSIGSFAYSQVKYKKDLAVKQEEYKKREEAYNKRDSELKEFKSSQEVASHSLNSAKKIGDEIAFRANSMRDLRKKANDTSDAKLQEEIIKQNLTENGSVMEKYFGKNTPLKTTWYFTTNKDIVNYEWAFVSNYDFGSKTTSVMWTCKSGDILLAYVIADFNAEKGTFTNPVKCLTYVGSSYISGTGGNEAQLKAQSNTNNVVNIIKDVGLTEEQQKAYKDQLSKVTEEDLNAQKEAMAALKDSQMKESGGGN